MTHEELLAKIDEHKQYEYYSSYKELIKALRAVVELHKPRQEMTGWGTDTEPTYKTICGYCDVNFPCGEFQAIEKGLQ